jgi:ketosteroid isomerase-like protein
LFIYYKAPDHLFRLLNPFFPCKALMNNKWKCWLICSLVAVVFVVWRWSQLDNDVRAIDQNLNEIIRQVEKESGESQLQGLTRGRRVAGYLAEGAVLEYRPGRTLRFDAESFPVAFSAARSHFSRIDATVSQHSIQVQENGLQALSSARIRVQLQTTSGQTESHQERFLFEWIKQEGDWRLFNARSDG